MKLMKKIFVLFLLFLSTKTFTESYKLHLKTFYTSDESITVEQLTESNFTKNNYVNSYTGNKYCWIETYIPISVIKTNTKEINNFIYFNTESFHSAKIFFLDSNNNWQYYGKVGIELKKNERTTPYWFNTFSIPQEILDNEITETIKLRLQIFSTNSSLVQLSLTTSEFITKRNNTNLIFFGILMGVSLLIILFVLYSCLSFSENKIIYIFVICILLFIKILLNIGIFNFHYILFSKKFNICIYIILISIIFCMIKTLQLYTKPFLDNFPEKLLKQKNFFYISLLVILIISLFYFLLPLSITTEKFIFFSVLVFLNIYFTIECYSSIRNNPSIGFFFCFSMLSINYILLIEQIFFSIRFLPNSTILCRLFDNNKNIPTILSLFLISFATLKKNHINIRSKLASIQIKTETLQKQLQEENKKIYLFSELVSLVSNPIQIICSEIEENHNRIPRSTYIKVTHALSQSTQILNVFDMITSDSENKIKTEQEPLLLKELINESIAPEIANLRLRNCYVDIKLDFPQDTTIITDKILISFLFKFILQVAINNANQETTILISVSYTNLTLTYKVNFLSEHITAEDKLKILSLEINKQNPIEEEKKQFSKLIKNWGLQLNIAKKILDLYHGVITISPDINGNSICAKLAVEPSTPLTYSYTKKVTTELPLENTESIETPSTSENRGLIYLLEEDYNLREEIRKIFIPYYKIISLANGDDFQSRIKKDNPDLIICSITLPRNNAFDILENHKDLFTAPFIVITKSITKKTLTRLYELGAFDVIQKPFNEKMFLIRMNSIIQNRTNHTNEILNNIQSTLKSSILTNKNDEDSKNHKEDIPTIDKNSNIQDIKEPTEKKSLSTSKLSSSSFNALCISANLTKKETSIALLISEGYSDKEIAEKEGISPATVAVHNKKIFKKLNIHKRSELINIDKS